MTLKRRGRMRRGLIVMGSAFPSIIDFVRGLWRGRSEKRWMTPLIVFLCVTGLLLVVAATVEALAPFVYSIF